MVVETKARIIACRVYDKKDKQTKEPTGEKGVMISLLIDEDPQVHFSGKVISPFVENATYRGPIDFSTFDRFETVKVSMDLSVGSGKEFYKLFDLNHIEKRK